ncbi:hypothetical protein [Bradyrhizobium sp. S69]|uniref:hypothetical protein n=1 Tax=Bradyrhizobium sp. S69 TaxID=1641856 RepID=UPI00157652B4|nr:hypothetical protein [Bradyrhizobium sp. S69]
MGMALSNPSELINLVGIDEPGQGGRKPRLAGICVLAVGLPALHIPGIDPADGSVRRGAAIWQRVWELCATPGRRPVFRGDFERPCHASINVHIPIDLDTQ